jgi:hypothetical protein
MCVLMELSSTSGRLLLTQLTSADRLKGSGSVSAA